MVYRVPLHIHQLELQEAGQLGQQNRGEQGTQVASFSKPIVALRYISVGYLMDICWISDGYLLDICWISIGYLLDIWWIPFGYLMDIFWISDGYPMDIC